MLFVDGGTDRVYMGRNVTDGVANARLQIEAQDGEAGLSIHRGSASSGGGGIFFSKSRAATAGDDTVVQSGDEIGKLLFTGADGTDRASAAASISVEVDGTPGSNDMPGRILFSTTADDAAAVTERMRISQGGQVSIGVNATPATTSALQVYSGAAGRSVFRHSSGDGGVVLAGSAGSSGSSLIFGNTWDNVTGSNFVEEYRLFFNGANDSLQFKYNANSNTAMTLDSTGAVTMPAQPAFLATLGTAVTNIPTDNSSARVAFNTEVFDQNSDYNVNGVFTAPVTGKYQLQTAIYFQNLDSAATYYIVYITTSNSIQYSILHPKFAADLNQYNVNFSILADMDAGDTATVDIIQNGGTAQTDIANDKSTNFSGYLAC